MKISFDRKSLLAVCLFVLVIIALFVLGGCDCSQHKDRYTYYPFPHWSFTPDPSQINEYMIRDIF